MNNSKYIYIVYKNKNNWDFQILSTISTLFNWHLRITHNPQSPTKSPIWKFYKRKTHGTTFGGTCGAFKSSWAFCLDRTLARIKKASAWKKSKRIASRLGGTGEKSPRYRNDVIGGCSLLLLALGRLFFFFFFRKFIWWKIWIFWWFEVMVIWSWSQIQPCYASWFKK